MKRKRKTWLIALLTLLMFVSGCAGCNKEPEETPPDGEKSGKITIRQSSLSLSEGESFLLTVVNTAEGTEVTFESADKAVADVDASGLVTAYAAGETYIFAGNGTKTTFCKVTVSRSLTLEGGYSLRVYETLCMYRGGTYALTPALKLGSQPVKNETFQFKSSAPGTVAVDENGVLTAAACGTAEITVTFQKSDTTLSASAVVTVIEDE